MDNEEHSVEPELRALASDIAGHSEEPEETPVSDEQVEDQVSDAPEGEDFSVERLEQEGDVKQEDDNEATEQPEAQPSFNPEEFQNAIAERFGQYDQAIEKMLGALERLSSAQQPQANEPQQDVKLDPEEQQLYELKQKPIYDRLSKLERDKRTSDQISQINAFKAKYAKDPHYPYDKVAPKVQQAFNMIRAMDPEDTKTPFNTKLEMAYRVAIADTHQQELTEKSQTEAKSQVAKSKKQPKADALSRSANPGRLVTKDDDEGSGPDNEISQFVRGLKSAEYAKQFASGD